MKNRALIFDCFGVLVLNSQEFFANLAQNSKQAKTAHDLFFQFSFGMISKRELITELSAEFDFGSGEVERALENPYNRNQILLEFLRENKVRGSKIAVLSNVAQYNFDEIFSREEQAELFDQVILSENEGARKPDRRIFKIACERLGEAPENCAMIDDLRENVLAAKSFGMRAVLYRNFEKFKQEMEGENA